MHTKLKFGLLGAGRIAHAYAEAFESCEQACLVAVADVRVEAAHALAEGCGCQSFDSPQAMLRHCELDAVVVCTPPVTHADLCIACVSQHIPVLCEKPLSLDVYSAHQMIEAARQAGVLLTMASKFRYVEDVIRAKSLVMSGLLGEIVLCENAFTTRVDMTARWNANPAVSGGGVLIDNGTHSVDLMRYFLGPLAEVHVVEGKRSQGLAVEETVRISVHSVSGVLGSIDLSWSIDKALESYLNIYGSHGTIAVGWKESRYRQASSRDWVVFGQGYHKTAAFRRQLDNFANAVRGQERLLITPEDALASVEVIEAAYAALRQSHWMAVRNWHHPLKYLPSPEHLVEV
jgi:predicted dehydrogenase